MQRPRSFLLLMGWFLWSTGEQRDGLGRCATTTDHYAFSSRGMPWLYFTLSGAVLLLVAASSFYLYRPRPIGAPLECGFP